MLFVQASQEQLQAVSQTNYFYLEKSQIITDQNDPSQPTGHLYELVNAIQAKSYLGDGLYKIVKITNVPHDNVWAIKSEEGRLTYICEEIYETIIWMSEPYESGDYYTVTTFVPFEKYSAPYAAFAMLGKKLIWESNAGQLLRAGILEIESITAKHNFLL